MVELKKKITLKEKHESPSVPQPPIPPSSNWWKWLVAVLILLVLVGGIYWFANRSGMTESAPDKIVADSTSTDSLKVAQTDTENVQQATDTVQKSHKEETNASNANSVSDKKQLANKEPNANTESVSVDKIKTDADVDNVEAKAKQVIRGDFGNGSVRKQKLGAEYTSIQNKVNEMYRTGTVR